MQVLIGISIGACAMLFVQLFVTAAMPTLPQFPTQWPQRMDTLAHWGRIRAYTVRTRPLVVAPVMAPLPMRVPGAALARNPVVDVWHLAVKTYALQDRLKWEWTWGKSLWRRIVRWVENELDPFATWDFTGWWSAAFYDERPPGHHRYAESPIEDLLLHDTEWMRLVNTVTFIDSHNRRVRTEAEWARIIATNIRTKAIRDAHRARRAGLVRKDDAVERDLATVRG